MRKLHLIWVLIGLALTSCGGSSSGSDDDDEAMIWDETNWTESEWN